MSIMQYLAIAAAVYCAVSLLTHLVKVIRLGAPKDKSEPSGSVKEGVVYANTIAMMPNQKESAYLHLPSYATGMLFHIGLFCCLLFFVLSFFPFFNNWIGGCNWHYVLAIPTALGTICKTANLKLKDIYELFPLGPARGACRVAGLPNALPVLLDLLRIRYHIILHKQHPAVPLHAVGKTPPCGLLFRRTVPSGILLRMAECVAKSRK